MLLRVMLAIAIIAIPNNLNLDIDTGIPVLNLTNLVMVALLGALLVSKGDTAVAPSRGMLTGAIGLWFAATTIAFAIATGSDHLGLGDDILYYKNVLFYPLFYFIFRSCAQDVRRTRQLIALVIAVAVVAGIEAVRQGFDYGFGGFNETRRASGPFGADYTSSNLAGVFYAMFLPLCLALALFSRRSQLVRVAAFAGCAILVMAIMFTYSRQSYLIAIIGATLLLVRRNVVLAVVIGIATIPAIGFLPDAVVERVSSTEQKTATGGKQLDVSTASRMEIWSGASRMWADFPAGVGLNRFKRHIGDYVPTYRGYDAHNFYVLTMSEMGPLGLAALLWLLWRLWRLAALVRRSVPRGDSETQALALGFTLFVISMALGNMYGSRFLDGIMMGSFWMLCGLMEHYAALHRAPVVAPVASASLPDGLPPEASIGGRFPLAAAVRPGRYGSVAAHDAEAADTGRD